MAAQPQSLEQIHDHYTAKQVELQAVSGRMVMVRITTFGLMCLFLFIAVLTNVPDSQDILNHAYTYWFIGAFVMLNAFYFALVYHQKIRYELEHVDRVLEFNAQEVARRNDQWSDLTVHRGEEYADPNHPFTDDLSLIHI